MNRSVRAYNAFDQLDVGHIVDFLSWLTHSHGILNPSVLDAGCGPGRMFPAFADLGWETLGIEPHPDFLEEANRTAGDLSGVSVRQSKIEDLDFERAFDLVVLINGPFSYLITPAQRNETMRGLYRALRPGGLLFLDMANFLWILSHYEPPETTVARSGPFVIERRVTHELDFAGATLLHKDHYSISGPDGSLEDVSHEHLFGITTLPEIRFHAQEAGFVDVRTYASYEARQPGQPRGSRLLVSALRPADA